MKIFKYVKNIDTASIKQQTYVKKDTLNARKEVCLEQFLKRLDIAYSTDRGG